MGGSGNEFRCQGECRTDWRQTWERAAGELAMRPKRRVRRSRIGKISRVSGTAPQTRPVIETMPSIEELIFADREAVENDQ